MAKPRSYRSVNESGSVFSSLEEVRKYPKTGTLIQEFKLFIEGIEVPWLAMSINQSYGALPTASIQIPYLAGLMEISRNYAPKVHIFYKDYVYEKYLIQKGITNYSEKDLYRTLFDGVAFSVSYGRQKSADSGSASISFGCIHKYSSLGQIILKFGARGPQDITERQSGEVGVSNYMNSQQALLVAMSGVENTDKGAIDGTRKDYENTTPPEVSPNVRALTTDMLPYFDRLQGIPGVSRVLWNTLKLDTYRYKNYCGSMLRIYIPLMEQGLRFFKRMSGHPSVEAAIGQEKIDQTKLDIESKFPGWDQGSTDTKILVPPAYRNYLNEAVATEISQTLMKMGTQILSDRTSFWDMMSAIAAICEYDLQVLASPVQVVDKNKDNIDVVMKPNLPYYFSPVCNVLLPHMYSTIQIGDSSNAAPTRLVTYDAPLEGVPAFEYRAPHEVRVVASIRSPVQEFNLRGSFSYMGQYPAPHEYGRGIITKQINLQPWVKFLASSHRQEGSDAQPSAKTTSSTRWSGQIVVSQNPKENVKDLWSHWDKSIEVPYYFGKRNVKGKNIRYGTPGEATGTVNTNIDSFRAVTKVPLFWNVVFFPFNNSYYAYPPHYDYVNRVFFIPADMDAKEAAKYNTNYQIDTSYDRKEEARATDIALAHPVAPPEEELQSGVWQDVELERLRALWLRDHPGQEPMNPFAPTEVNGLEPFQATLVNSLDYEYAKSLTSTRQGSVDGMFNPFIIPGYPMDIIDPSPERPSFHAFCVAVSHNITPRSVNTSISFSNALSYDELRSYELPALLPWFQKQLAFGEKLSLVKQTKQARDCANQFYKEVLGCGFADPTLMENEVTNSANFLKVNSRGDFEVTRTNVNMSEENSTQSMLLGFEDQNMTYEGNMALIRREIETMSDIEALGGITFVEIPYTELQSIKQSESVKVSALHPETLQKPGRSLFLDYSNLDEEIRLDAAKYLKPAARKGG